MDIFKARLLHLYIVPKKYRIIITDLKIIIINFKTKI